MSTPKTILVIDNYDSFVYNLVQYIGELGAIPRVYRNNRITLAEAEALEPDGILISPGPGRPEDARISNDILTTLSQRIPTLGVCLGQQCLAFSYGAHVIRAPQVMHGKTSQIYHDSKGVFSNVPSPTVATRYHSLIVDTASVPVSLEVSATSDDGEVMGLRHREFPIETVQFHPESVLSEHGYQMIRNFLNAYS